MLNPSMRGEAAPSELLGAFPDLGREVKDLLMRPDAMKLYQKELQAVRDEEAQALKKVETLEVPLPAFPDMEQAEIAEATVKEEKRFLEFFDTYLDEIGKRPAAERKYLHLGTLRKVYGAAFNKFVEDTWAELGEKKATKFPNWDQMHKMFMEQMRVGPEMAKSLRGAERLTGDVEKTEYTKEDGENDFKQYMDMYLSEVGKKSPAEQKFLSVPMMRSFYDKAYKNFVSDLLAELGEKKSTKYPNESEMHKLFLEQVRVGPEMAKGLRGAERLSTETLEEEPEDLTAFAEEVPAKKSPPKFKGPKPSIQQAA